MWTDRLRKRTPRLHRFLTPSDKPWPLVRELLGILLVLALLVGALFVFTQQPLSGGYPVVVVTTGSMMHCRNANPDGAGPAYGSECVPARYGRIGFIDPGDLVFVRHVSDASDVATLAAGAANHYGKGGDVVVYRRNGDPHETPIIHRALFWLQSDGAGRYSVPELGIRNVTSLDDPRIVAYTHCTLQPREHDGSPLSAAGSGFITKGDNNPAADQCPAGLNTGPARVEWILGKARGEVPWLGLIKLFVDDTTSRPGTQHFAQAGSDSKVMLAVTVVALLVGPWAFEAVRRRRGPGRGDRKEPDPSAKP